MGVVDVVRVGGLARRKLVEVGLQRGVVRAHLDDVGEVGDGGEDVVLLGDGDRAVSPPGKVHAGEAREVALVLELGLGLGVPLLEGVVPGEAVGEERVVVDDADAEDDEAVLQDEEDALVRLALLEARVGDHEVRDGELAPVVAGLLEAVDAAFGVAVLGAIDGLAIGELAENALRQRSREVRFLGVVVTMMKMELDGEVEDGHDGRVGGDRKEGFVEVEGEDLREALRAQARAVGDDEAVLHLAFENPDELAGAGDVGALEVVGGEREESRAVFEHAFDFVKHGGHPLLSLGRLECLLGVARERREHVDGRGGLDLGGAEGGDEGGRRGGVALAEQSQRVRPDVGERGEGVRREFFFCGRHRCSRQPPLRRGCRTRR